VVRMEICGCTLLANRKSRPSGRQEFLIWSGGLGAPATRVRRSPAKATVSSRLCKNGLKQ